MSGSGKQNSAVRNVDELAGETGFAETLRRYDTIYLPSVACMSDIEAAALDRFVE